MVNPLALSATLDAGVLAAAFAARRRLQIDGFLAGDGAERLAAAMAASEDWRHVIGGGAQVFEAAPADLAAMPPAQRAAIDAALVAEAESGFRFRFDTIRTDDAADIRARRATTLDRFADMLNSPAVLDFFRQVGGAGDIALADAQATRYRPGDFLGCHDDAVAGKGRRLAYVLGLSREWRADWGGLLLFHGADGGIVEAIVPRFNALALFAVPQPHSVSYVAPFAAVPRLAITGWLRAEPSA